jgi:hypothetical protein
MVLTGKAISGGGTAITAGMTGTIGGDTRCGKACARAGGSKAGCTTP